MRDAGGRGKRFLRCPGSYMLVLLLALQAPAAVILANLDDYAGYPTRAPISRSGKTAGRSLHVRVVNRAACNGIGTCNESVCCNGHPAWFAESD
jgi:hypothetical protein